MIYIVFFQEYLYICVVKFFSVYIHIRLQIFPSSQIIFAIAVVISTLSFERYGLCVPTQYIDNGENVVVIFVESCVRTLDHINHRSSYP